MFHLFSSNKAMISGMSSSFLAICKVCKSDRLYLSRKGMHKSHIAFFVSFLDLTKLSYSS